MLMTTAEAPMTNPRNQPDYISRPTLIRVLREELSRRANGEMSICRLAAETGIFCKGFRRYSDDELRERYGWISKKNPDASREELEAIADRWQMARQDVVGAATSCDVQQLEHDACGGWDDFSNDDLARFLRELTGRRVEVTP
jgi:hypothetical protein